MVESDKQDVLIIAQGKHLMGEPESPEMQIL
jgi:hypothetical protein